MVGAAGFTPWFHAVYGLCSMKYAIIIADGAGDYPLKELGGRTPLQAARTPAMDRLASMGRLLTAKTTPPGFGAGSDICTMDLLGYDPRKYHTGRAPLEAAAIDMPIGEHDFVFRVNLVTVGTGPADSGKMLDHSAGGISDAEAKPLFEDLLKHWQKTLPARAKTLSLRHGVSYRSSMVDSSRLRYDRIKATPPHEIPGEPWERNLPVSTSPEGEPAASALRELISTSQAFLAEHPINRARIAAGKRPGNTAWIWGQGTKPMMPSFKDRFGIRGSMITAVDLLAGIAKLIGWDRLDVPGVTSYHDTDYAAQGSHTVVALDRYDLVVCHVESPDESSHQGDWRTKVAAIEAIDEKVVAPVLEKCLTFPAWRLMVLPDHYTLVSTRKHDATPVPIVLAGSDITPQPTAAAATYDEASANASPIKLEEGHELMAYFLGRDG